MSETPVQAGAPPGERAVRTFLIADVRGYTRFTVEQGDEAAARLTLRFAEIAAEMVAPWSGEIVELRGDEALIVFTSPRHALQAAIDLQVRYTAERRTDPSLPLEVGIGLDAGEAVTVPGGYRGAPLNLAARLCSLARTGEVLISDAVVRGSEKIPSLAYLDRGEARIKGFPNPVRITQVVPEGEIPDEIPRFSVPATPTNLPAQATPFVGRSDEVASLVTLLESDGVRLLTLTGTGGTGKTRMAIQVGNAVLEDFPDGVFFQPLEAVDHPDLIPAAIATTLGLKESAGRDAGATLVRYMADRKVLPILDNFEHLLDGARFLSDLVAACPGLKLLVTSRAPLRLKEEHSFEVSAMRLPDLAHLPDIETLARNEAVRLFLLRAQAVNPGFALTPENAPIVAEICVRLDGLPLAIELAAARVRLLPPPALLGQLASRLNVLTHGPRNAPARHQTLRQAIDWSYNLLAPEQQRLLAELSAFAGGWSLEAAETIYGDQHGDVLDGLATLVDNSLVRSVEAGSEPRFTMLETIREYAVDQVQRTGREPEVRRRHAEYFEQLAASMGELAPSPERFRERMKTLETEHDNLRAALSWSIHVADADRALRMVHSLWSFWWTGGHFSEGSRWAESALATGSGAPALRARAMEAGGIMAWADGRLDRAKELLTSALDAYEREDNIEGMGAAISTLGLVAEQQGELDEAVRLHTRYLETARGLDDQRRLATALGNLGGAMLLMGDQSRAESLYNESLAVWRGLGAANGIVHQLNPLAFLALERGDSAAAAGYQREALTLGRALGNREILASTLDGAGRVASVRGSHAAAAILWGAASAIREELSQAPDHMAPRTAVRYEPVTRVALGDEAFAANWETGRSLATEDALDVAIELLSRGHLATTAP